MDNANVYQLKMNNNKNRKYISWMIYNQEDIHWLEGEKKKKNKLGLSFKADKRFLFLINVPFASLLTAATNIQIGFLEKKVRNIQSFKFFFFLCFFYWYNWSWKEQLYCAIIFIFYIVELQRKTWMRYNVITPLINQYYKISYWNKNKQWFKKKNP